LNLNFTKD